MLYFRYFVLITFTLDFIYSQTLIYSAFSGPEIYDFDDWHFVNIYSETMATECGGEFIVGGYEKFGHEQAAMKFLQLPPHYRIKISFTLFIIDQWNDYDLFYVYIDQKILSYSPYQGSSTCSNLCGMIDYGDQALLFETEIDHNGSTVNLYLSSTLDGDAMEESWGFKNFELNVYLCPSGCLTCTSTDLQLDCLQWILYQSFYTEIQSSLFSEDGWIINNGRPDKRNGCYTAPIICGRGICGKDTILQLFLQQIPTHTKMKIKLKYVKINSWDDGEIAIFNVDGETKSYEKLFSQPQYTNFICEYRVRTEEVYINIEITFDHSQNSALIEILNNLNEDCYNEAFGIRDVEIFIDKSQIICGDQIVQSSEDCDDGNLFPFDGCFNCQYSCVDGCSLCNQGICYSCFPGWDYQIEQSLCLEIINLNYISQNSVPILQSELSQHTLLQCQIGFQLNYISGQCESICGDNFITNYEECDIESEYCLECKFQCSIHCELCQFGICQVCKEDYFLSNNYCVKPENINICQPQCDVCIESTCYRCQSGQILILGQCQEICGNNNIAIYTLDECVCDLNCQECLQGVCSKCQENYILKNNLCVEIIATCGDFITQEYEECDDGNDVEFDGCYYCLYSCPIQCQNCQQGICQDLCEHGFYLISNNCRTICGDSIVAGNEQCEDNNSKEYDGCYLCQYSCPKDCLDCLNGICITCNFGYQLVNINNECINICGDGILSSVEQCDDGNQNNGDGCSKTCQVESDWICEQGTDCAFVKYPIFKTEYIEQNNQYQYVQISFSQPIQSYSNISYKNTIQVEILNLNQTLYDIIITEVQPAYFKIISEVSYMMEIQIFSNLNYKPTLKVNLTEQLFNSYDAPLINTIEFQQLYQPQYITQSEIQFAQTLLMISKISIFSIFGSSLILIIFGSSFSFWGILDALQQQSYLKYINVLYPQTLMIYFQSSNLISVEQLINNITKMNKMNQLLNFPQVESYEKFKYYEVNSNIIEGLRTEFLVFTTLLIYYLTSVIFIQIVNIFEINETMLRFPRFIRLLQKYQKKLNYHVIKNKNLVQNTFLACTWDLILMSFLEINTPHDLQHYRSCVRLITALLILTIILIFILNQMKGITSQKKQNFYKFWGEKKELFYLIKKLLIVLVLVFYQKEQILQTMLLTLINLFFLIYVIKFKPFDEYQEYLKNIIMETSLTLFTASTFANWNLLSNYFQFSQKLIISWIQISLLVSVLLIFMLFEIYNTILILKVKITKLITKGSIQKNQIEQNCQKKNNQKQQLEQNINQYVFTRVSFVSQFKSKT